MLLEQKRNDGLNPAQTGAGTREIVSVFEPEKVSYHLSGVCRGNLILAELRIRART